MTPINQRNATIDIAKGIVIILMCIGHSNAPQTFCQWFGMFRMPFFFMMSGYFFSPKSLDSPLQFTMKRVKGIYMPFVTWGLIFVLLHNFFLKVGMLSAEAGEYTIKDMLWRGLTTNTRFIPTEEMMAPYWFLSALFYVSIFSFMVFWMARWISRQIRQDRRFDYISSILFILIYIVGFLIMYYLPNSNYRIYNTMIISFLFYLGYNWRKYSNYINYNIYILAVALAILSIGQYCGRTSIALGRTAVESPILLILYSLSGAYIILYISRFLDKIPWIKRVLAYVGENTIVILLPHVFFIRLLHYITFYLRDNVSVDQPIAMFDFNTEWYWWILYTVFLVVMPLSIKSIYNRVTNIISTKLKANVLS